MSPAPCITFEWFAVRKIGGSAVTWGSRILAMPAPTRTTPAESWQCPRVRDAFYEPVLEWLTAICLSVIPSVIEWKPHKPQRQKAAERPFERCDAFLEMLVSQKHHAA